MKKTLLFSSALLVGSMAIAQSNARANMHGVLYKRPVALIEQSEGTSTNKVVGANNTSSVNDIAFTSSRNGYGVLLEMTNPLQYDADLNMLSFHHRIATAAQWPTSGLTISDANSVSGYQNVHYSTDGGSTWSGVCLYSNNTYWGRYPSGAIANPPGNTDPANAYFVNTGPCTVTAGGWVSEFFASCPANSTGNLTTNDQQAMSTVNSGNAATWTYFSSYSTVNNGTDVWTGGYKAVGGDYTQIYGAAIIHGTLSGGAFIWSQDSTTFAPWVQNAGGDYYTSDPKIAFGPDHMTGYVLVNGVLTSSTGEATKSMQPNVWKTTDGGSTWTLVNPSYDWSANHPEILCNLANASQENIPHPAFLDPHGSGVSVDANGVLHYVTTIVPTYSSHIDSLYYVYSSADNTLDYGFSYTQFDDLDKPYIYDLTTDGNGTWTVHQIGKLFTRNIKNDDAVPDPAIWTTDGSTPNDYVNRVRVSRSPDGTKMFYTWTDGDTTNVIDNGTGTMLYHANSNPFYEYVGLDVTTGMYTNQMELNAYDAAESGYYFSYTSPVSMPTTGGYIIPMVYIVSQDGNTNATNAIDYDFVDAMMVADGTYSKVIPANTTICVTGVKENLGTTISSVAQNFPNPFSATTNVKVNLSKAEDITLTVTNSIGQVMSTTTTKGNYGVNELTIDGSSLASGLYFFSISAGDSKVTRKMNVVK